MKIPYVIDNIHVTLAGVLNYLLDQRPNQQLDIASAYFSIRGFQQLRKSLGAVGGLRLLLGDSPGEGADVGVRPDSAAYLRGELNAEPLSEETQRLVEELVRFLRRHDVQVRLYLGHSPDESGHRREFLHAKCYLVYGGKGDQLALAGLLNPLIGIVGSSNFTGPGLTTNRELNLVHKTLLEPDEVDDSVATAVVAHHAEHRANPNITSENKRLLKSEVGARAIDDLVQWYDEQWMRAVDFKDDLIDLMDILISTDVLSEGQNLQDCGYLINYDLHWNPTRMVQRAGRIDRLGSDFDVLTIYNMFPEAALEDLLGLVRRLTEKIDTINQTGFLDASVLGEVVTPRDFNTLRRIADEDDTVIDEQEAFLELASSESMLAELQKVLATEAQEWITDLADGIHSGLWRDHSEGVFFYFKAPQADGGSAHFWRYYDLKRRQIIDNRYQIMQIIACGPETPRFPPPYDEVKIYDLQERVIADIMGDIEQQQAAAVVSKVVAEEQNVARQVLQQHLSSPDYDRRELRELRNFLKQPLVGVSVKRLRQALRDYSSTSDVHQLVSTIREICSQQRQVTPDEPNPQQRPRITREDLRLVCYEYICS